MSAMKMTKKENYRKENDLHMKENELHMKFGKNQKRKMTKSKSLREMTKKY